ncbi:hypothetical protein MRX96_037532 [Rhipicephalus microplus]
MYPNDHICQYLYYSDVIIVDGKIRPSFERNSWIQFQRKAKAYVKVKSGIAFDHWYITPQLVQSAVDDLNMLARNKIGSYGLLNIIRRPKELKNIVQAMKPVIEALKDLQGSEADRRTVIAIGSYDYRDFMKTYKEIIRDVINTFKADAVIAISSVSSMEDEAGCFAVPPNVLRAQKSKFPSLETHWPLVRGNETYAQGKMLRGLSFEMGSLIYILDVEAASLRASPYTSSSWHDERTASFTTEVRGCCTTFTWGDVRRKCGSAAFALIKWFCQDYRAYRACGP